MYIFYLQCPHQTLLRILLMFTIRKSQDRGLSQNQWLHSQHTFSFAHYYDEKEMGFSDLLVINDDQVAAAQGFGTHPHQNMEILTYVLSGQLAHQDSMGNGAIISAGDVQIMSAGTGVRHSEYNHSQTDAVHFLQIWIVPNENNLTPSYQQKHFDAASKMGQWRLLLSPTAQDGSLQVHQDAYVYAAKLDNQDTLTFDVTPERYAYLHVVSGQLNINGQQLKTGDGIKVQQAQTLALQDAQDAEVLLFNLRKHSLNYR